MKCEKCGNELTGSTIICRKCKHNNARQRVMEWRESRSGDSKQPAQPANKAKASATRSEMRQESDDNLIRFPATGEPISNPSKLSGLHSGNETVTKDIPDWRAQVKEKVRLAREKRMAGKVAVATEPDEADLDPNPIVQAALRRIQRATPPVVAPVGRAARYSGHAAALAEMLDVTPEPQPVQPAPKSEMPLSRPQIEKKPVINDPASPARAAAPAPTVGYIAPRPASPGERQIPPPRVSTPVKKHDTIPPPPASTPVKRYERTVAPSKFTSPPPAAPAAKKAEPKPPVSRPFPAEPAIKPEIKARTVEPPPAPKPAVLPPVEKKQPPAVVPDPVIPVILPERTPEPRDQKPSRSPVKTAENAVRPLDTQVIELPLLLTELPEIFARPASLWERILAGACDFEVIFLAYLPVFAAYATLDTTLSGESLFILVVLLGAMTFIYQAVTLSVAGRTFGMALLNLQLVNTSDERMTITRRQRLLRAWGATLAFLCPPLNFLVMKLNRQELTLPDLISGTSPVEQ